MVLASLALVHDVFQMWLSNIAWVVLEWCIRFASKCVIKLCVSFRWMTSSLKTTSGSPVVPLRSVDWRQWLVVIAILVAQVFSHCVDHSIAVLVICFSQLALPKGMSCCFTTISPTSRGVSSYDHIMTLRPSLKKKNIFL